MGLETHCWIYFNQMQKKLMICFDVTEDFKKVFWFFASYYKYLNIMQKI